MKKFVELAARMRKLITQFG